MPRGRSQREDPFANVRSWDDGYEYIKPDSDIPDRRGPSSFHSRQQPSKHPGASRYGPDGLPKPPLEEPIHTYARSRQESAGSTTESHTHVHRSRGGRSPPPPMGSFRAPSPPRQRDKRPAEERNVRHSARSGYVRQERGTQPGTNAFEPTKPSRRRTFSPSPSPPPRRRAYSPSPPRHRGTRARSPRRDRYAGKRNRLPSPSSSAGYSGSGRPSIHRFKTTSVKDPQADHSRHHGHRPDRDNRRQTPYYEPSSASAEAKKKGRPEVEGAAGGTRPAMLRSKTTSIKDKGLSPRWQKAAVAALQAGGLAAMNARSQPGAWKGEKGARVATAALGAAAMDAFKQGGGKSGGLKEEGAQREDDVEGLGGAIGGLLAERLASRKGRGG